MSLYALNKSLGYISLEVIANSVGFIFKCMCVNKFWTWKYLLYIIIKLLIHLLEHSIKSVTHVVTLSQLHILSFKFGKLNVWFPVPIKVKLKMLGLKCSKYIPGHYKTFNFGKFIF